MWQDKLKEIIYLLENSDVNEIDVNFWGRRFRVVKSAGVNTAPEAAPVPQPIVEKKYYPQCPAHFIWHHLRTQILL